MSARQNRSLGVQSSFKPIETTPTAFFNPWQLSEVSPSLRAEVALRGSDLPSSARRPRTGYCRSGRVNPTFLLTRHSRQQGRASRALPSTPIKHTPFIALFGEISHYTLCPRSEAKQNVPESKELWDVSLNRPSPEGLLTISMPTLPMSACSKLHNYRMFSLLASGLSGPPVLRRPELFLARLWDD